MKRSSKWRFWAWPAELRRAGVLGINERNRAFVMDTNPRSLYPRVDDKVLTKKICARNGIPVPETFAVIENYGDINRLGELIGQRQEFVLKPAEGSAGRGVLVIVRQTGVEFETSSGAVLPHAEVHYHVASTLSGLYSLGGQPDKVIVEERVRPHPVFEGITVRGTPDIRVLCYRGRPVMAMLRLPTVASRGRANLHQGALGVGIDLATGATTGGVCRGERVSAHPDTGMSIENVRIPWWGDVLPMAAELSAAIGMGYLGIDIVLDEHKGPVVLEANARPGLSIQIANACGLLTPTRLPAFRSLER